MTSGLIREARSVWPLHRLARTRLLLVAGLALAPVPSLARAPKDVALEEASGERVICRSSIALGSIVSRQLHCMTARAWNQTPDMRERDDDYSNEPALIFREPSSPDILKTGTAPWNALPKLRMHGRLPYGQLVSAAAGAIRKGECALPGQSAKRFDIDAPFAVQVGSDGHVKQVVVGETGCAGINSLIALTVFARAERGDLELDDGSAGKWFGSRLRLTLL